MQKITTTLCLLLLLINGVFAQTENAREDEFSQDIRHMFMVNGSKESYRESIKTMFTQFKSMESDVPADYWDKAEQEFLNTSLDEIIDMMVPIYKKHLTHEEVKAFIQFYESPAGKSIAKKTPVITTESMQVGMIWGQTVAMRISADVQSKGYKIRLPFSL